MMHRFVFFLELFSPWIAACLWAGLVLACECWRRREGYWGRVAERRQREQLRRTAMSRHSASVSKRVMR